MRKNPCFSVWTRLWPRHSCSVHACSPPPLNPQIHLRLRMNRRSRPDKSPAADTISPQNVSYSYGPDSQRKPGVPQGKVIEFNWMESKVFPGRFATARLCSCSIRFEQSSGTDGFPGWSASLLQGHKRFSGAELFSIYHCREGDGRSRSQSFWTRGTSARNFRRPINPGFNRRIEAWNMTR